MVIYSIIVHVYVFVWVFCPHSSFSRDSLHECCDGPLLVCLRRLNWRSMLPPHTQFLLFFDDKVLLSWTDIEKVNLEVIIALILISQHYQQRYINIIHIMCAKIIKRSSNSHTRKKSFNIFSRCLSIYFLEHCFYTIKEYTDFYLKNYICNNISFFIWSENQFCAAFTYN